MLYSTWPKPSSFVRDLWDVVGTKPRRGPIVGSIGEPLLFESYMLPYQLKRVFEPRTFISGSGR